MCRSRRGEPRMGWSGTCLRCPYKAEVGGSSPSAPTTRFWLLRSRNRFASGLARSRVRDRSSRHYRHLSGMAHVDMDGAFGGTRRWRDATEPSFWWLVEAAFVGQSIELHDRAWVYGVPKRSLRNRSAPGAPIAAETTCSPNRMRRYVTSA